jgi:hypothetical protein
LIRLLSRPVFSSVKSSQPASVSKFLAHTEGDLFGRASQQAIVTRASRKGSQLRNLVTSPKSGFRSPTHASGQAGGGGGPRRALSTGGSLAGALVPKPKTHHYQTREVVDRRRPDETLRAWLRRSRRAIRTNALPVISPHLGLTDQRQEFKLHRFVGHVNSRFERGRGRVQIPSPSGETDANGKPKMVDAYHIARTVNETLPGHKLHPGKAWRDHYLVGDEHHVITTGTGTGKYAFANELAAPSIFGHVNRQLSLSLAGNSVPGRSPVRTVIGYGAHALRNFFLRMTGQEQALPRREETYRSRALSGLFGILPKDTLPPPKD